MSSETQRTKRRIRLRHVSFFQSRFWPSCGPSSSNRLSWNRKAKKRAIRLKLGVMLKMMREVNPLFRLKVLQQTPGIKRLSLRRDKRLDSNRRMLEVLVVMRFSTSQPRSKRKRRSLRGRGREKLRRKRLLVV